MKIITSVILLTLVFALWGCPSKQPVQPQPVYEPEPRKAVVVEKPVPPEPVKPKPTVNDAPINVPAEAVDNPFKRRTENVTNISTPSGREKHQFFVRAEFDDESAFGLVREALVNFAQRKFNVIPQYERQGAKKHKWTILSEHGIQEWVHELGIELGADNRNLAVTVRQNDDKTIWIEPDR